MWWQITIWTTLAILSSAAVIAVGAGYERMHPRDEEGNDL